MANEMKQNDQKTVTFASPPAAAPPPSQQFTMGRGLCGWLHASDGNSIVSRLLKLHILHLLPGSPIYH